MNRRIRIAHLISPMQLYGKEKWLLALLAHLDRDRFHSIVMPMVPSETFPLAGRLEQCGCEYHPIFVERGLSRKAFRELVRLINERDVDIVHSHDYRADFYALMARKRIGAKIISTPHGWSTARDPKLQMYQAADRFILRYFDLVVPLSKHMIETLKFVNRQKVLLIDNFVDLASLPSPAGYDPKLVTYLGRLTKIKRVEDIITAIGLIDDPEVRLQIVGDGPLRGELEKLARTEGISPRVTFTGFRDNALDYLNRSACLVIASLTEGISRVTMEAMGMGKQVIGTDIPGIRALIEHERTGLLVPTRNPEAIASAIRRITGERDLAEKMGKAARKYIEERRSAEVAAGEYGKLYTELSRGGW